MRKNVQRRETRISRSAPPVVHFCQNREKAAAKSVGDKAKTDWVAYFSQGPVPAGKVQQVVQELTENKQHEEVIACLQQAIIHGQIQPWMYEVLALSMKFAGRPAKEIERVLLSSEDVTPQDAGSQLYLAAYLVRFDRLEQALRLYRQASQLEPNQPQAYSLALPVAVRVKDDDAIAWSAPGIVRYVWGSDRKLLVRQAETAAREAGARLRAAGRTEVADELDRQMQSARQRDLVIRLEWSGDGDLDLLVTEPGGSVCSRENAFSGGGGVHLFDGYGPDPARCYEEYVCPQGQPGEYIARVRHISGKIVGKRATLTVTRRAGSDKEDVETHIINLGAEDRLVRISLVTLTRTGARMLRPSTALRLTEVSTSDGHAARSAISATAELPSRQVGGPATGVAPAVGFGAVGYQPVIQMVGEGVSLGAMAVVSGDRKYVRLTLSPTFSSITDVFTFSFVGGGN